MRTLFLFFFYRSRWPGAASYLGPLLCHAAALSFEGFSRALSLRGVPRAMGTAQDRDAQHLWLSCSVCCEPSIRVRGCSAPFSAPAGTNFSYAHQKNEKYQSFFAGPAALVFSARPGRYGRCRPRLANASFTRRRSLCRSLFCPRACCGCRSGARRGAMDGRRLARCFVPSKRRFRRTTRRDSWR